MKPQETPATANEEDVDNPDKVRPGPLVANAFQGLLQVAWESEMSENEGGPIGGLPSTPLPGTEEGGHSNRESQAEITQQMRTLMDTLNSPQRESNEETELGPARIEGMHEVIVGGTDPVQGAYRSTRSSGAAIRTTASKRKQEDKEPGEDPKKARKDPTNHEERT